MKNSLFLFIPILITLYSGNAFSSGPDFSGLLIGSWVCESGPCPDEEIAFSIEEGRQSYNSWLHARPSAVDGNWQLDGNNLLIECCAGLRYEFTIISITGTDLELREQETDEVAVLRHVP